VKFTLTDNRDQERDAAAKLEDIKVGDYVSGTRLKRARPEYEVIKISNSAEDREEAAAPAARAARSHPGSKEA